MDQSAFMEPGTEPGNDELKEVLGELFGCWEKIRMYTREACNVLSEEWNFSGPKYGWNYRLKDKRRVIVYLLPRVGYFKVALVFGDRAVEKILHSAVRQKIKEELSGARKYAEGRGIRIDMKEEELLEDIFLLINIKLDQ